MDILGITSNYKVLRGDLNHPKQFINLVPFTSLEVDLLPRLLESLAANEAFIVYTESKADTEELLDHIVNVAPRFKAKIQTYHSELTSKWREELGHAFVEGTVVGILGTQAFEMGVDKSDVLL